MVRHAYGTSGARPGASYATEGRDRAC